MTGDRVRRDRVRAAGALLLLAAACGGCGTRSVPGPDQTEAGALAVVVRTVPDRVRNPNSFRELFADGAAPTEAQRPLYARYQIEPISVPRIEGDTATVEVRVYDDRAGKDIGKVTWTLAKQGDKWKLKTAPLP
jgi:hypothetical protein